MWCEAIFPFWSLFQCLVSSETLEPCEPSLWHFMRFKPVTFSLVFEGTCVYSTFSFMGDNSWQKGKQLQTEKCSFEAQVEMAHKVMGLRFVGFLIRVWHWQGIILRGTGWEMEPFSTKSPDISVWFLEGKHRDGIMSTWLALWTCLRWWKNTEHRCLQLSFPWGELWMLLTSLWLVSFHEQIPRFFNLPG